MAQHQQVSLEIKGDQELNSSRVSTVLNQPPVHKGRSWKWWFLLALNATLLVSGQCVGNLLGRFYFDQGGKSIWMATLVQSCGFPILFLPLLINFSVGTRSKASSYLASGVDDDSSRNINGVTAAKPNSAKSASLPTLVLIYISLGMLLAGDNIMYSYGLLYLPVSTYSLVCATQLAFNAVLSYFINSQKFTSLIFNSVVLLSLSASLLAVRAESSGPAGVSAGKRALGFMFTLLASAGYALWLSLTQLIFQKVLKETFSTACKMLIYISAIASSACIVGLYASGQWGTLKGEMKGYAKGRVSYVMTLVWTAVGWQVSSVGTVCLVFQVSALFTNVISTFALPLVPVLAVILFHDKMDGVKTVALLLAFWGFLSYIYQHYLDDRKAKRSTTNNESSNAVSFQ